MRPTEAFGHEHEQLLEYIEHIAHAAREMPRLFEEERDDLRTRILGFLRGTLLPHARTEEEILYPEWAKLVGFSDAAVPMVHDHEAIVHALGGWRPRIRATSTRCRSCSSACTH
jgi:hypothetical protein